MPLERFGGAASTTPRMHALFEQLRAVASNDPVLLRGERSSGRETLARAMHELARPGMPFIVVDMASIPTTLVESALFGHVRLAFTGAHVIRRGPFEDAESGTVVIREIAATPLDVQPKLMRLVHARQFKRVGDNVMRPFNGRIVALTHANLEEVTAAGWFRPELRAALTGHIDLELPPLRDRIADLPALLAGLALDEQLHARLAQLRWRGNFAQLAAFVRAADGDPAAAVTELELLEAIEDAPDDDGLRLVYADALSRRGDRRGELIHLQCRLAEAPDDYKLRAAERKLLEQYHRAWAAPVIEVATTPVSTANVTFARGFVDAVEVEGEVLRQIDAVLTAAPLLTRVTVHGHLESPCWTSPALRQLHALEVTIPMLGATSVAALAGCPYLTGLRSLSLRSGAPAATPDDPMQRQAGVEALATSPHLAGVTALTLTSYELAASNLATLLADTARWNLTELALVEAELDANELAVLASAPKASALRLLDLRTSSIRAASATVLAGATSFTNLTTLRLSELDAEAREILRASSTLAGTLIYDGKQVIR